jgi:hypothetical protein
MFGTVLKEAVVVGIMLTILGMILHLISKQIMAHDMNNNVVLAVHFLVIGILFHILCEVFGLNKWYCKHGKACSQ